MTRRADGSCLPGGTVDHGPISTICPPDDLLKVVFECSTDAIILLDAEGKVREWSAGAARIWGYSRDQVLGREGSMLGDDPALGPWVPSESINAQPATIHRHPGGESIPILALTQVLRDEDGRRVGAVKVARDVIDVELFDNAIRGRERALVDALKALRNSHEQLKGAQLSLVQAAKLESIGRLAAGVAHEVKNPLAIVLTGVQLLQCRLGADNPETMEVLQDLEAAVKRANQVVRGLLDFAAATELKLEPVSVHDLVSGSIDLLHHECQKRRVQVVREEQEIPLLRLDRTKIEQILINLIMNALDVMRDGGQLTVRTYTRQLTETGHGVGFRRNDVLKIGQTVAVVEVDDTGPGIPPEVLARVFDPFYTTKPAGKGTGLGLAVCRTIAGLHRGSVWLDNKPGGGTRATLWLPAGESEKGAVS